MSRRNPPDQIAGWAQLWAAAGPSERDLLELLRRRPRKRITSVEQLAPYVSGDEEAAALAALVSRATAAQQTAHGGGGDAYERHKRRTAARQSALSRAGREIGPLPPVRDPERKAACQRDLKLYLETYHRPAFPLPWAPFHLAVIHRAQVAVLLGARSAIALPRGSGKSTLSERSLIFASIYGHRLYSMLLSANEDKSKDMLADILADMESNPVLLEDFPEVCYPLLKLDSIRQRSKGQLLDGRPTKISISDRKLILPDVLHSPASGAILQTGGLLGAVRGAKHRLPSGAVVRPDLVLIDDPSTRESSESSVQNATRIRIISADVLGMSGPTKTLSALLTCTVAAPGDVADSILDRERFPQWRGERHKLLIKWPDDDAMALWEEYLDILRRALQADPDAEEIPAVATAYYLRHRKKMDAGAEVSWEARHPGCASAIQFALTLALTDPATFQSEYQNEPVDPDTDEPRMDWGQIAKKTNSYRRGQVPQGATWITAFADCHKRVVVWSVLAVEPDFTCYLIDYGTWPRAARPTWRASSFRPTLMETHKGTGAEGALYAGLKHVADELIGREWQRDDGSVLRLDRLLIDSNYDTATVRRFCREHPSANIILPSFGRSIGSNEMPISSWKQRPGEIIGDEFMIRRGAGRKSRHVLMDVAHWKSFLMRRFATPQGDPGALTLFGREVNGKRRASHDYFARQIDAEHRERIVGRRAADEWTLKPGQENHYLDCLVGCLVGGSICGAKAGSTEQRQQQQKKLKLSDLQRQRRR